MTMNTPNWKLETCLKIIDERIKMNIRYYCTNEMFNMFNFWYKNITFADLEIGLLLPTFASEGSALLPIPFPLLVDIFKKSFFFVYIYWKEKKNEINIQEKRNLLLFYINWNNQCKVRVFVFHVILMSYGYLFGSLFG